MHLGQRTRCVDKRNMHQSSFVKLCLFCFSLVRRTGLLRKNVALDRLGQVERKNEMTKRNRQTLVEPWSVWLRKSSMIQSPKEARATWSWKCLRWTPCSLVWWMFAELCHFSRGRGKIAKLLVISFIRLQSLHCRPLPNEHANIQANPTGGHQAASMGWNLMCFHVFMYFCLKAILATKVELICVL